MSYIYLAWADKTTKEAPQIKIGRTTGAPAERYTQAERTRVLFAARVNGKYLKEAEMALKNYFSTRLSTKKTSPERWIADSNIDLSESVRLFKSFCSAHKLQCNKVEPKPYDNSLKYKQRTSVVSARVPYVLAEDVKRICYGRSFAGHKESLSSIINQALIEYRNKHRAEYPKIS